MARLVELEAALGEALCPRSRERQSWGATPGYVDVVLAIPEMPEDRARQYIPRALRRLVSRTAEWGTLEGPYGSTWYIDGWNDRYTYLATVVMDPTVTKAERR